jgi:hypothetical protein
MLIEALSGLVTPTQTSLGRPLPFYALVVRQQVSDEAEFLGQVLRAVERNG